MSRHSVAQLAREVARRRGALLERSRRLGGELSSAVTTPRALLAALAAGALLGLIKAGPSACRPVTSAPGQKSVEPLADTPPSGAATVKSRVLGLLALALELLRAFELVQGTLRRARAQTAPRTTVGSAATGP